MVLGKISMNEFQKHILEKEKMFEARLKELSDKNKQDKYIGQKLGAKTIIGIEHKQSGSKIRTYLKWKCDCGIEGVSQKHNMLNRIPKCTHHSKNE